jgi:acetyl esterase/lipase
VKFAYGLDADQYAELYLPTGSPRGVVVIIHGGFWRAAYDASLGRPLAVDLAGRGWAAYNIEYRRFGRGGGWPNTLSDVAAAIDQLADLDLDLSRVLAVGHSAGGHLATWAAGRARLRTSDPGAVPRVPLNGVVSQAGVLDLATAATTGIGGTACSDLLGGLPSDVPARYAVADPMAQLPLPVPVFCVHSRADESVPFAQSQAYCNAARVAGADAKLVEVAGDHMSHVDPASPAWAATLDALTRLEHA